MKQVYVLRHAQKNNDGLLTQQGRDTAKLLRRTLPQFKIVIASNSLRTQETANLLTGISPQIDLRAGYFNAPKQINDEINKQALVNPRGFIGAYLDNREIKDEVTKKAEGLIALVLEVLRKLNSEEKALIISHEITLVPAIALFMKNKNVLSFNYLSGFIIDDEKNLTFFYP